MSSSTKTHKVKNSNYNILIVEDSPSINETIFLLLSDMKIYNLHQVLNFQEAKKSIQKNSYDFIILDLNLPDAYGEKLVSDIKKLTDAKIIVLTGEVDIELRESLFKKGILDYLVKENHLKTAVEAINYDIKSTQKNSNDTILIIDDSTFTCKQLKTILNVRNYNVIIAHTAKKSLEILHKQKINAIVLDMELPDKHGLELLHEIKHIDGICDIPVLILSGTNDPEVIRDALKTGASDFIKKPFNIEEFTLKVDLSVDMSRKHTEVLESQKMLSEYKEALDEGSLVSKTDSKGRITYVNDLFCKLSGYTKDELIGSSHNLVRHPDIPSATFKEMWKTLKEKRVWKGTLHNRTKLGETYYVNSMIKPILDIHGNIVEYIAIRTDVTKQEAYKGILEKDLCLANNSVEYLKQYEKAIDEYVAVIKTDTNNIITYINKNFSSLSGYSKDELIGQNCAVFKAKKHLKKDDCQKIQLKLQKKETVSILFENITKDKQSYFVDTKIYPLLNKDKEVIEHLHLMYNVTDIIKIHEELEATQKDIIYRMGEIGESRSQETGNHVKRVAEYSKILALLAGVDEEEANILYAASPMHDIGKVAIPDTILKKPGRLTSDEFEIMKTHAEIGYQVLKGSGRSILKTAATVAHTHHEKWDGSGYPQGLKGEQIHIFGRITALVDVFDALGSDRVYKKAWKLEKILTLFKEEKGKHFDPNLVELFLENLDKFLKIRETFQD
jgi:PAS domain S-box-containing protein